MPLVNPLPAIKKAQEKRVAIAAFNIHNMESIQAVVEGAAEERAPVILQTTPGTLKHAGIAFVVANVKTSAELYDIPIALHLDHCTSLDIIAECIDSGYTSVMIDGSHLPYDENVALVRKVVDLASQKGVAVEAELGRIRGVEDGVETLRGEEAFTDPEEAKEFVTATGIDTLAVAIGTAHGEYKGEPKLDFTRLLAIRELVDLPLVLHGASGVPDECLKEAIRRGICKVNIATELKIPMVEAIKSWFRENPTDNDPRNYMGAAKREIKKVVRHKIRLCGCSGLADEVMAGE